VILIGSIAFVIYTWWYITSYSQVALFGMVMSAIAILCGCLISGRRS